MNTPAFVGSTRGRPRNAYAASETRWRTGATNKLQLAFDDIAEASVRIEQLVKFLRVPVLRSVLEAILIFDHGWHPGDVTEALKNSNGLTKRPLLRGGRRKPADLYTWLDEPTRSELSYLERTYQLRESFLTKEVLKCAGEGHARSTILHSGRFSQVTTKERLGEVIDCSGKNKLDLVATDKITGLSYGISVKNHRPWLFEGSKAIKDVFTKATAHQRMPWLIVPFATDEARQRCHRDGIRLTVWGRRIVPAETTSGAHMRGIIESLRSVIGPIPFEYAYSRFDKTLEQSALARLDVESLVARKLLVA